MKALAIALLITAPAASASSHRIAVVVGANRGALGRPDLRYSYRDAQDVADTLIQVGEFKPADVHVLQDPPPRAVLAALDRELAALRAAVGESLLVFSGIAASQVELPRVVLRSAVLAAPAALACA
jgi:hypothetical protein